MLLRDLRKHRISFEEGKKDIVCGLWTEGIAGEKESTVIISIDSVCVNE